MTSQTTARAPRKPTDRKGPSASDRMQASDQPPAGHDLLKSADVLRSGETAELQASLLELFENLGVDLNAPDAEFAPDNTAETIRAVGKMGALLEGVALDHDAYVAFDTGRGAFQRVLDLGMWYLGQLGEADGSAT